MKNATTIFCTAAFLARAAFAVTMASQPWTMNRIAEAEARLSAKLAASTNGLAAKADLGGYLPLTGGTLTGDLTVDTPTGGLTVNSWIYGMSFSVGGELSFVQGDGTVGIVREGSGLGFMHVDMPLNYKKSVLVPDGSKVMTETLTNEKLNGYATKTELSAKADKTNVYTKSEADAKVDAAIREQSLGGIWDETLQVWWTPRMRNGSLTYEATTNVNLNAEN